MTLMSAAVLLIAQAVALPQPDPFSHSPRSGPERLTINAALGKPDAEPAIRRWLDSNANAPAPVRAMMLHRLCLNYTVRNGQAAWLAACREEGILDPGGDASGLEVAKLLWDAPELRASGAALVPLTRSPDLGSRSLEATANGVTLPWIVDTGAGLSTVTQETAKRLGVRMLGGTIQGETATSITVNGAIGIVDRLAIGGAVIENMPVYVLPDETLTFGSYTAPAILGLPALAAFGKVAWLGRGRKLALGPAVPPSTERAGRLYWTDGGVGFRIVTPLGAGGAEFDSGAAATTLYDRGLSLVSDASVTRLQERAVAISGAGGTEVQKVKTVPQFTFRLDRSVVTARSVHVQRSGTTSLARVGDDAIEQTDLLSLDFCAMSFSTK